jgi:hypothetical protein
VYFFSWPKGGGRERARTRTRSAGKACSEEIHRHTPSAHFLIFQHCRHRLIVRFYEKIIGACTGFVNGVASSLPALTATFRLLTLPSPLAGFAAIVAFIAHVTSPSTQEKRKI